MGTTAMSAIGTTVTGMIGAGMIGTGMIGTGMIVAVTTATGMTTTTNTTAMTGTTGVVTKHPIYRAGSTCPILFLPMLQNFSVSSIFIPVIGSLPDIQQ